MVKKVHNQRLRTIPERGNSALFSATDLEESAFKMVIIESYRFYGFLGRVSPLCVH